MEENAREHGDMPDIMAGAAVVEETGEPALRNLGGVDAGAQAVDQDALHHGRVEVQTPAYAARVAQLGQRREPGQRHRAVEGHPCPRHVGVIEDRMPGEDDAADTKRQREQDVDPPGGGLAVESRVLRRHDGRGHQKRDSGVVNTGETLHQGLTRNAVHGVPDGTADQTFARCEEKDGGDHDIRFGTDAEIRVKRVKVESDGEHNEEPDQVRPDIEHFVGESKH